MSAIGAGPTVAQTRAKVFRLPAEPVAQAVLRFALQGDVSVGWMGAVGCQGLSRPVQGAMAPSEALSRLLPSGCGFQAGPGDTYRIVSADRRPVHSSSRGGGTPAPPPPAANPAAETAAAIVGGLVVTAEKRAEPIIASPYPISAVSGSELLRLGGSNLQAVAPQLGGLASTNLGPGRNKVFVRGLSDGSFTGLTQSTVGLYLDETPITYNAPDPALRLTDVARLEVLRGPQGSLYGSGSIGGIIRVITNRPDPTRYSASVAIEGALTQHGAPSATVEAVINAPLGGQAAARLVAYDESQGGYIDNPRRGLKDVNDTHRQGVRLSLAAPLGDWRLLLSGVYQSIDNHDTQYTLGAGKLTRANRVAEPHDNDIAIVSLMATRPIGGGDLRLTATHVSHSLHTRYDASHAFDVSGLAAFDEQQRVNMDMGQAEFASATGGRAHWLVGLFAAEARQPQDAQLVQLPSQVTRSVYSRDDALTEAAAYGEFGYDLTSRLTFTFGGRLFRSWLSSHADEFDLQPLTRPRDVDLKDSGFAPKLRLSYTAAPDRVVYLQAQEGFRTGGFNLPVSVVGLAPGEPFQRRFRPDRLWSYEIGGELPLRRRRITLRAALFHARWRNVQTDQYLASGLPITVNIGDGENTGLEAEAVWTPDSHWRLRANGLWEDPEVTRTALVFPARPRSALPGVPRAMAAGDLLYRWSPAPGLEADVSAQYAYVGHSSLTFVGGPSGRMGGYGLGRVSAELTSRAWSFQLYLDNVLDERGNTFAFGNPFMPQPQATPLRPRTLGARLERSF